MQRAHLPRTDPKHLTGTSPDSPPIPTAVTTVVTDSPKHPPGVQSWAHPSGEYHVLRGPSHRGGVAESRAKALVGILPLQLPVCALSKQPPDPQLHTSASTPINRDDGLASLYPPHTQHRPRRDPPITPRSPPLVLAPALTLEGPPTACPGCAPRWGRPGRSARLRTRSCSPPAPTPLPPLSPSPHTLPAWHLPIPTLPRP